MSEKKPVHTEKTINTEELAESENTKSIESAKNAENTKSAESTESTESVTDTADIVSIKRKILIRNTAILMCVAFAAGIVFSSIGWMVKERHEGQKKAQIEKSGTSSEQETGEKNVHGKHPKEQIVKVGSSFEDQGLKITVKEADTDYQDYEDEEEFGYDLVSPAEGMRYVMVAFTIENTSGQEKFINIYDFECYADEESCPQLDLDSIDFINATLSQGETVSFHTYYEVSKDAKSIRVEYEPNFWSDEKVIIQIF